MRLRLQWWWHIDIIKFPPLARFYMGYMVVYTDSYNEGSRSRQQATTTTTARYGQLANVSFTFSTFWKVDHPFSKPFVEMNFTLHRRGFQIWRKVSTTMAFKKEKELFFSFFKLVVLIFLIFLIYDFFSPLKSSIPWIGSFDTLLFSMRRWVSLVCQVLQTAHSVKQQSSFGNRLPPFLGLGFIFSFHLFLAQAQALLIVVRRLSAFLLFDGEVGLTMARGFLFFLERLNRFLLQLNCALSCKAPTCNSISLVSIAKTPLCYQWRRSIPFSKTQKHETPFFLFLSLSISVDPTMITARNWTRSKIQP